MKTIYKEINMPPLYDTISIYFIGDIHVGHNNFEKALFQKLIRTIKENKNAYVIGMGDFVDCINPSDKRFNPSEIDETYKIKDLANLGIVQADMFVSMMLPIKDKIITLVSGNHEEKYKKVYNVDVFSYICNKLSVNDNIEHVGLLLCKLNYAPSKTYRYLSFFLNHGDGGNGKREGYPLNILHDVFRWSNCDVNIMGHIHQLVEDHKYYIEINTYTRKYKQTKKLFGVSGTFLRTVVEGSRNYFEHKGRQDSTIGCLRLDINMEANISGSKKDIKSRTLTTNYTLNKVIMD